MPLGPSTQRTAWRISWLSAGLAAVSLAVLVHLLMSDAPLRDSLVQIALCGLGAITLSLLCATSAALALAAAPNVSGDVVRTHRFAPSSGPFASETPASHAA